MVRLRRDIGDDQWPAVHLIIPGLDSPPEATRVQPERRSGALGGQPIAPELRLHRCGANERDSSSDLVRLIGAGFWSSGKGSRFRGAGVLGGVSGGLGTRLRDRSSLGAGMPIR